MENPRDNTDAQASGIDITPARRVGALRTILGGIAPETPLLIGVLMCVGLVLAIAVASFLVPHDPQTTSAAVLDPPSAAHLLGTDSVGRDVLARLIGGTRYSILLALAATAATLTLGLLIGVTAGYFGGIVDWIEMRVVDIFLSMPPLLVAIAVLAAAGPSTATLLVVLIVTYAPQITRIVRASTLQVVRREFVDSARISRVGAATIIWVHILPNIRGLLIVQATITVAQMMMIETILSFLGLGVQPPAPSLGFMVSEGRQWMELAPWVVIAPGTMIVFAVAAFSFVGHGLDKTLTGNNRRT